MPGFVQRGNNDEALRNGDEDEFEFFVLNLCHATLAKSTVTWRGGDLEETGGDRKTATRTRSPFPEN